MERLSPHHPGTKNARIVRAFFIQTKQKQRNSDSFDKKPVCRRTAARLGEAL